MAIGISNSSCVSSEILEDFEGNFKLLFEKLFQTERLFCFREFFSFDTIWLLKIPQKLPSWNVPAK
jgi:hypothetical protein